MKKVHESAEDYLEAILKLQEIKGQVHAIDVVKELGVSKPSVSVALKNLASSGYLDVDDMRHIQLSETGFALASKILGRHRSISVFLEKLGVSPQNAMADACKMEHDLSDETFNAILSYMREH